MNIDMTEELGAKLAEAMPELAPALKRASMYNKSEFKVSHQDLGEQGLQALRGIAKEAGERGLMMQLTSLINIVKDPRGAKIGNLRAFEAGLIEYLKKDAIDGWLYERDSAGEPMPQPGGRRAVPGGGPASREACHGEAVVLPKPSR